MRWLTALIILFSFSLQGLPYIAAPFSVSQTEPVITPLEPASQFGKEITFRVRIEPAQDIKELLVFITPEGQSTVWQKFDLEQLSEQGEFTETIKAHQLTLSPFSQVAYYFEVILKSDRKLTSEKRSFIYEDNRFVWQNLKSGIFQVYWNSDDPTLGQDIANIAQQGLQRCQQLIDTETPEMVRIYAYTKSADLQEALQLTSQPWVAGHTTPELNMIMISIPSGPERTLELRRQIPHEIMHILQYQVMGKSFTQQPVWLVEGMASLAELADNPEYRTVLKATSQGELLPFQSLCVMFPRQAASAYQAYAQSQSFVGFLQQKFGTSTITNLVEEYKNGVGCEEGVYAATGYSLTQLDFRWQQEVLGIDSGGLVFSNLLPYLSMALIILVSGIFVFLPRLLSRFKPVEE
jgi:hypothetical protein